MAYGGAILLLAGLCAKGIEAAREESRRSRCDMNLRVIGLALVNYQSAWGCFPPASGPNDRLPPAARTSWQLNVLSQMFCFHCWNLDDASEIDLAAPWDADPQRRFAVLPLEPLLCPSSSFQPAHGTHSSDHYIDRSRLNELVPATYIGIAGIGKEAGFLRRDDPRAGVFGYDRGVRSRDIRDGASTTMAVAETSVLQAPWTSGGDATVRGLDPSRPPYIGRTGQFGGTHQGGISILFADGSVRHIRESIDPKVFEALATIAGGEPLAPGWDQ
jgi:prepilin-type processing-associated H-X9-DG protein